MIIRKLIGPFRQLLTMNNMALKGSLSNSELEIIENAGILTDGDFISAVGNFDSMAIEAEKNNYLIEELSTKTIAIPGFIDPHTHLCWAGDRANDYSMRLEGKSYIEIAQSGGGIWSTVEKTRESFINDLTKITTERADRHIKDGVTTIEVKSGYGLSVDEEQKMLTVIKNANRRVQADLIPTCLAAHICPKDFSGSNAEYLEFIAMELLPQIVNKGLASRVDIYCDESAFKPKEALKYLLEARGMGFEITVHADQFSAGGSEIAVKADAVSADHLEASGKNEIKLLAESDVIPVALPASSIGLGYKFAPARKLLDAGASLAIGSDWNPGSAPMGDLLVSAAILGIYEKLTIAETFAALTYRAAAALDLKDRGIIKPGNLADFIAFELNDFKEILYYQGKIKPSKIWKKGILVK
jgi:imidazolonepropionase